MSIKCIRCNSQVWERVVDDTEVVIELSWWKKIINIIKSLFKYIQKEKKPERIRCKNCGREYSVDFLNQFDTSEYNFYKKKYLMSKVENVFFEVLKEIVNEKYEVYPQIPLNVLVNSNQQAFRNKINRKRVDFVIFSKEYYNPLLVIELDDKTHELEVRVDRDNLVDMALFKCDLPILHVNIKDRNNKFKLQQEINYILNNWNYNIFKDK